MRIKTFEVIGFKSDNRIAILKFPEGKCSVIFGPNGIGKTTILQIMSAFLSKSEDVLLINKVKKIKCDIYDENKEHTYHVEVENKDGQYFWDLKNLQFFDKLKSLSIGVERGIAPQNISINPMIIFDFLYRGSTTSRKYFFDARNNNNSRSNARSDVNFRNDMRELATELSSFLRRSNSRRISTNTEIDFDLAHINLKTIKMENIEEILFMKSLESRYRSNKNMQSALFDTMAAVMNNPNMFYEKKILGIGFLEGLKKYKIRIKEAIEESGDNKFIKNIIDTLDYYCENKSQDKEINTIYFNLFDNMIKELEMEDKSKNSMTSFLSSFNNQLEFGKKLVIDGNRKAYVDVGGEHHGLNELSSGERHILTFLTLVSTVGDGRDFIFIDEPEISLNLKWQRNILPLIESILPNAQIIVASHSPAISQDPATLCKLCIVRN